MKGGKAARPEDRYEFVRRARVEAQGGGDLVETLAVVGDGLPHPLAVTGERLAMRGMNGGDIERRDFFEGIEEVAERVLVWEPADIGSYVFEEMIAGEQGTVVESHTDVTGRMTGRMDDRGGSKALAVGQVDVRRERRERGADLGELFGDSILERLWRAGDIETAVVVGEDVAQVRGFDGVQGEGGSSAAKDLGRESHVVRVDMGEQNDPDVAPSDAVRCESRFERGETLGGIDAAIDEKKSGVERE
jgi:hypothetical protein